MTPTDTLESLRQVIASTLGVPVAELRPQTRLDDDLALDSLDRLQLLFDVEERFGVAVPDSAPVVNQTLAELAELLDRQLSGSASEAD
jgi:acyl carrier protein